MLSLGDSYYAKAGAKFLEGREAAGGYTLQYKLALKRAGVAERTERRAVQFAANPAAEIEHKAKNAEQVRRYRRGLTSDRAAQSAINNLPEPAPKMAGEIGEAAKGFKASMARYHRDMDRQKVKEGMQWRTTAMSHFEVLVKASNLPAVSGLSVDEIMRNLRR